MSNAMGAWVYILQCSDGSYYVGRTTRALDERIAEHNEGRFGGYTARRRPVSLEWAEYFETIIDAFEFEARLKGWSRAKKEALMAGDIAKLKVLARRRGNAAQNPINAPTNIKPNSAS
jgi:putative endonuclease